jgi:membrane protein implicated in regulation of membrane protease activity
MDLASWLWLIFVVIGVLLVLIELVIGINTGLDLVFIGSAFLVGGFVSWIADSWIVAIVLTGVICITYLAIGRRFIHRWTSIPKEKTNIDTIIGASGVVINRIAAGGDGLVKVGNEEWRARSGEDIEVGEPIQVKSITGVTLFVTKKEK